MYVGTCTVPVHVEGCTCSHQTVTATPVQNMSVEGHSDTCCKLSLALCEECQQDSFAILARAYSTATNQIAVLKGQDANHTLRAFQIASLNAELRTIVKMERALLVLSGYSQNVNQTKQVG